MATINADLSGRDFDVTRTMRLVENAGVAFMGDTKGGAFDVEGALARAWLKAPLNPNGRPNSDVLHPWVNGLDLTRRPRDMWIVDFGWEMSEDEAALYEEPFAYIRTHVKRGAREKSPRILREELVAACRAAPGDVGSDRRPLNPSWRGLFRPSAPAYRAPRSGCPRQAPA